MKLSVRPADALLLVAGLSACDIPTGAPRWQTTWITPAAETSVSVGELLPAALTVNPDTSAFLLSFPAVSDAFALAEFCAGCPAVAVTAPKPAFQGTVSTTLPLPASIESVTIEGGQIEIELVNGFAFDPLRPGVAADSGTLTIEVLMAGVPVASGIVDGATQAFPSGDTLALALPFTASDVTEDLEVELTLDSPAGDLTTLDPSDEIGISIEATDVEVSEAVVQVPATPVGSDDQELDLSDLDVDDLRAGTIFINIANPFGVTGALTLTLTPDDGPPIVKPVEISAADSSQVRLDFDRAEIERLAGQVSDLSFTGTLGGSSVTVRPDLVLGLDMRLRFTIELGGGDDDNDGDEG
jgi:hypothetical protein